MESASDDRERSVRVSAHPDTLLEATVVAGGEAAEGTYVRTSASPTGPAALQDSVAHVLKGTLETAPGAKTTLEAVDVAERPVKLAPSPPPASAALLSVEACFRLPQGREQPVSEEDLVRWFNSVGILARPVAPGRVEVTFPGEEGTPSMEEFLDEILAEVLFLSEAAAGPLARVTLKVSLLPVGDLSPPM